MVLLNLMVRYKFILSAGFLGSEALLLVMRCGAAVRPMGVFA